jgi:hypothetical protein
VAPQTLTTNRDVYHPGIDARGGGNVNKTVIEISERTFSILSFGLALIAIMVSFWISRDNDRLYRHVQELRIRVEDAELAAQQVNPNFKPVRQPKEH